MRMIGPVLAHDHVAPDAGRQSRAGSYGRRSLSSPLGRRIAAEGDRLPWLPEALADGVVHALQGRSRRAVANAALILMWLPAASPGRPRLIDGFFQVRYIDLSYPRRFVLTYYRAFSNTKAAIPAASHLDYGAGRGFETRPQLGNVPRQFYATHFSVQ